MVWKPKNLYYLFLIILIITNIVLYFYWTYTTCVAEVSNVLLPFSIYHMIMSWSGNCVRLFGYCFLFLFLDIQLSCYIFSDSLFITVDMFLNLVTTNPGEALELLDNLIPAIIIVVLLYIPALVLAAVAVSKKRKFSNVCSRERKRARITVITGILSLVAAYLFDAVMNWNRICIRQTYVIILHFCLQRRMLHRRNTMRKPLKDFTFQGKNHRPEKNRKFMLW